MGMDNDIAAMELPGILEHGAPHGAGKTAERDQGHKRQGNAENKNERLFPGIFYLPDYEAEMDHLPDVSVRARIDAAVTQSHHPVGPGTDLPAVGCQHQGGASFLPQLQEQLQDDIAVY